MSRTNPLIFFIIFTLGTLPFSRGYYTLWEQDIFIEKNDHILINITDIGGLASDHILQSSGDLKITLVKIPFPQSYKSFRNIRTTTPFLMSSS